MKRFIYSTLAIATILCACEKDGEKLIVKNPEAPSQISASDTDIVLTADKASALVLTLYWDQVEKAEASDPTVALPSDLVEQTVQFSYTEDFLPCTEVSVDTDRNTLQLTGDELSKILVKLGLTEVKKYDIYVRLCVTLGKTYTSSNTLTIKVTPYAVETGIMKIVDKNDVETVLATLHCKKDTPSLFEGFAVTPSGWYNCFFIAADGVQWGCNSDWTTYSLVANSSNNCWFAEPSGCQYVFADTQNNLWWQVYAPSVNATVDGTAVELKYLNSAGGYSGTITTSTDATVVTISGEGQRFDTTTGTNAGITGTSYPFSLVPSAAGTFEFVEGSDAAGNTVTVEKAGTYTLVFNVTDYSWTLTEGEGGGDEGGDEDEWPEDSDWAAATGDLLYIYTVDGDKNPTEVTGKLLLADNLYQGYFYFTGWYNFAFGDTSDASTTKVYGSAPVSDTGLYRLFCGSSRWNIWFPSGDAAYAKVTVNMAERSWAYETIETISIVGDFNNWSLTDNQMTFDPETKTYSADVTVSSWGTYGIHFVVNSDWNWCFSDQDGDGVLDTEAKDFMPSVEAGTYKITIDLNDPQKMTCKFE